MSFRKYDHVERFGSDDVEGIEIGTVHVFPKLDGTNASVWRGHGLVDPRLIVMAGSRTRQLGRVHHEQVEPLENHGFCAWATGEKYDTFKRLFEAFSNWHIYGEWLVPHTLKTYRADAWRRFWIFDVWNRETKCYVPYDEYVGILEGHGLDVIHPLCTFTNPTLEQLRREVDNNTFLVSDGAGAGEGVVLKNYHWVNRYGRQPWAKIVRNEFKEENARAFGTTEKHGTFQVEAAIAERYVTQALVQKTRDKIKMDMALEDPLPGRVARGVIIPRLLQTMYHEVVKEELWDALKEHKDPTINFKTLRKHVIHWTKVHAADLF